MVLVQPTPAQIKKAASEKKLPYQVLRKDTYAHIVKDIPSGTIGYVVFEPLEMKDDYLLASDAETLVLLRPVDKKTRMISICDPKPEFRRKDLYDSKTLTSADKNGSFKREMEKQFE